MSSFASHVIAVCTVACLFFHSVAALAIPMPVQVKPGKPSVLTKSVSTIIGGESGEQLSLLSVRTESGTESASLRSEKLVLTFGDRSGKPLVREPGFFHVSIAENMRRVVIDLAQVNQTAIDPAKLARILATSRIVESSEMTMDPHDQSTNITLSTKVPVNVKVASEKSGGSRLVIELVSSKSEAR